MSELETDKALEQRQLKWRCRRGMRELDVLLTRFLDNHYANVHPTLQAQFKRLLEQEDDQLWDWLLGRTEPEDADLKAAVTAITSTKA